MKANLFPLDQYDKEHKACRAIARSVALAEMHALIQRHGILTHASRFSAPKWMAIIPLPEHAGMEIADIMACACRLYDEGNLIYYGATRRQAVMLLVERMGLQ